MHVLVGVCLCWSDQALANRNEAPYQQGSLPRTWTGERRSNASRTDELFASSVRRLVGPTEPVTVHSRSLSSWSDRHIHTLFTLALCLAGRIGRPIHCSSKLFVSSVRPKNLIYPYLCVLGSVT